jgi:hypothetical protein
MTTKRSRAKTPRKRPPNCAEIHSEIEDSAKIISGLTAVAIALARIADGSTDRVVARPIRDRAKDVQMMLRFFIWKIAESDPRRAGVKR